MNIPFQILSIFSEEEEKKNFSYQIITKFLQLQHFDKKAGNFTKINIQYSIPKLFSVQKLKPNFFDYTKKKELISQNLIPIPIPKNYLFPQLFSIFNKRWIYSAWTIKNSTRIEQYY